MYSEVKGTATSKRLGNTAVVVGLILFRDTSKDTDNSGKSLHSLSLIRMQQPRYSPQGQAMILGTTACDQFQNTTAAFLKLWSADHKWSSGSALVVLLD